MSIENIFAHGTFITSVSAAFIAAIQRLMVEPTSAVINREFIQCRIE